MKYSSRKAFAVLPLIAPVLCGGFLCGAAGDYRSGAAIALMGLGFGAGMAADSVMPVVFGFLAILLTRYAQTLPYATQPVVSYMSATVIGIVTALFVGWSIRTTYVFFSEDLLTAPRKASA